MFAQLVIVDRIRDLSLLEQDMGHLMVSCTGRRANSSGSGPNYRYFKVLWHDYCAVMSKL